MAALAVDMTADVTRRWWLQTSWCSLTKHRQPKRQPGFAYALQLAGCQLGLFFIEPRMVLHPAQFTVSAGGRVNYAQRQKTRGLCPFQ